MTSYDVLGNIAILKFKKETRKQKLRIARAILKEHKNISTVLEKKDKIKGRLRTMKTNFIFGKKTKEALYLESGCKFKLNIEKCYFSPRLSGERLEIAGKIKKKDKVLILFAGVAPFSIIIAKKTGAKVVSVELGRDCCKYALENVKLNKLRNVEIIQGDVKNPPSKWKLCRILEHPENHRGNQDFPCVRKLSNLISDKFDVIVMPRPQLKETFLRYIWKFTKKGTRIYYYDFGKNLSEIVKKVEDEAKKGRRKIKIINMKKAGDIAPYKYRFRIDFIVLP